MGCNRSRAVPKAGVAKTTDDPERKLVESGTPTPVEPAGPTMVQPATPTQNQTVDHDQPCVGQMWRGVEVHGVYPLSKQLPALLVVSSGSVVDFDGDAIVNAANEGCVCGGGVDGAITQAGGDELYEARMALPVIPGTRGVRCPTGESRITIGGSLRTPWCIHAVGPNYNMEMFRRGSTMEECDELVTKAYQTAMECAREKTLQTVAFSLISASIFRGSQTVENVLNAGINGIRQSIYPELREVHLVGFTRQEVHALLQVCGEIAPV